MPRSRIILRSKHLPSQIGDVLRSAIDEKQWTPFSRSGFKGTQPVIGRVSGNEFQLQKRRYYRNDFAGQFYGRFVPDANGTRIEGYFDSPAWARWFMRVWLAGSALIGIPLFCMGVIDSLKPRGLEDDGWVSLVIPPALLLFGYALPKLGRFIGRSDEKYIVGFLEQTLSATAADSFGVDSEVVHQTFRA